MLALKSVASLSKSYTSITWKTKMYWSLISLLYSIKPKCFVLIRNWFSWEKQNCSFFFPLTSKGFGIAKFMCNTVFTTWHYRIHKTKNLSNMKLKGAVSLSLFFLFNYIEKLLFSFYFLTVFPLQAKKTKSNTPETKNSAKG